MTVASKLKQTIASLEGAVASMENYACHHPDHRVQDLFKACQKEAEQVLAQLNRRLQEIEFEEPQYKGF